MKAKIPHESTSGKLENKLKLFWSYYFSCWDCKKCEKHMQVFDHIMFQISNFQKKMVICFLLTWHHFRINPRHVFCIKTRVLWSLVFVQLYSKNLNLVILIYKYKSCLVVKRRSLYFVSFSIWKLKVYSFFLQNNVTKQLNWSRFICFCLIFECKSDAGLFKKTQTIFYVQYLMSLLLSELNRNEDKMLRFVF